MAEKKKCFRDQLADKMREAKVGAISTDAFSDKSSSWVSMRANGRELVIAFDAKGENIQTVTLYNVSSSKVWGGML